MAAEPAAPAPGEADTADDDDDACGAAAAGAAAATDDDDGAAAAAADADDGHDDEDEDPLLFDSSCGATRSTSPRRLKTRPLCASTSRSKLDLFASQATTNGARRAASGVRRDLSATTSRFVKGHCQLRGSPLDASTDASASSRAA